MEDEGDVATAFTLARILSNIPISRGGPSSLVIFDIHALQASKIYNTELIELLVLFLVKFSISMRITLHLITQQERFYFGDSVLPCFESGIPLLKSRLQELPDSHNVSTLTK
jgi:hypothetical protein